MDKTPTAQLNIRVPQDVLERLRSHAALLRQPVSAVVLEAIGECLDGSGANRETQAEAPSPMEPQQPEQVPKAPPTIPHQPQAQARQPRRQRPRRRISLAAITIVLAVAGAMGMAYWFGLAAGAATMKEWLRWTAALAIIEQADAAEEILAIGANGVQRCLGALRT